MAIRKNILIWYWGRFGAAQRYTYELVRELIKINIKKKKFNLYFSFSNNAELSFLYKKLSIKKYSISTFESSAEAVIKTLVLAKLRKNFFSMLTKNKIDTIFCPMFHYWNPYFSSKFKEMNIKYIFGIHDYDLHSGENNFIKKKIYEKEKVYAENYICYSKYVEKKLKINKIKKKNILLSSFETNNFIFKKKHKIHNLKFVFFGRFLKYKGLDKLIKIFSKKFYTDNKISLTLIGSKDKNFQLPNIKSKNINVISKWIDELKIDKILQKYDICILPYDEASQSGVVSIMFRNSIPVIATPVGAFRDQIKKNFNGLISKNITTVAIEKEIKKIINLKLFYKLRKGAIKTSLLQNKNFSNKINIMYDFLN